MKLLHIDSSILGNDSVTRKVTAAAIKRLREAHPDYQYTYRDLFAQPLPDLTLEDMPGYDGHLSLAPNAHLHQPDQEAEARRSQETLDEFMASDIIVIGAPMYNLTIPTQLKSWIDRVLIARKTFRYTPTGIEGLAKGKRVILAVARGSFFGLGTPLAHLEFCESYLVNVFGVVGIKPEILLTEGLDVHKEHRQEVVARGVAAAASIAV